MPEGTTIGQSVDIKGEVTAGEDLTIEGQVEGTIQLPQHAVVVGPNGRVTAKVQAKIVEVRGRVTGDIAATEKLTLGEGSAVMGDLRSPRVAISDGANFKGQIDMSAGQASNTNQAKPAKAAS